MTPLPHYTNITGGSRIAKKKVQTLEFIAELYKDDEGEIHRRIGEGEWDKVSKDSLLYKSLEEAYQKTKRADKLKRIANE